MNRRLMLGAIPALPFALVPDPAAAAEPGREVVLAVTELVDAITAETFGYRAGAGCNGPDDDTADKLTSRVHKAAAALVTLPLSYSPLYRQALALMLKNWMVAEGAYASPLMSDRVSCSLIDAVLAGTALDDEHVPMLWHINGREWPNRPPAAALRAAMDAVL